MYVCISEKVVLNYMFKQKLVDFYEFRKETILDMHIIGWIQIFIY